MIPQRSIEEAMTEQDVQNWLDEYGRAWVNGDPDQVVTLFSDSLIACKGLRECRSTEPIKREPRVSVGVAAQKGYWDL